MDRDPMELALSTDIVMDVVLSYLKSEDLLSCRLVSNFWNTAASSVLRKRWTMIKEIFKEGELMELKICLEQSWDFPFVGLNLYDPCKLKSDRATEFFQNYGGKFTRLRLETHWVVRLQDLAPFIVHLPRLCILEVYPPGSNRSSFVLQDSDGVPGDLKEVLKLPSVRTVRFLGPCSRVVIEGILLEVLTAVSPSVQIECLDVKPGVVRALQSAGLLRAVSFMKFPYENHTRKKFRTEMDELLSNELPSLTKLDFDDLGCLSFDKLEKLLVSSRYTLKNLRLKELWLTRYRWEHFPVLANLTKLSLNVRNDFCNGSLFRGRHGDKFPALKELHLYVKSTQTVRPSYSSDLFVVPSVTRLELQGFIEEDAIEQLALSLPNVIGIRVDFRYYDGDYIPFRSDPFKIWSLGKFKFLESLKIWNFTVRQSSERHFNMDSFLTGIPIRICEKLRKRKKMNLVNSPFDEPLREKPNILQLENLKQLTVCVKPKDGLKEPPEVPPFISMVSVWYALEMMPDLRANFVYELDSKDSPSKRLQDKILLEAAFKHVQPSIKLQIFH